MMSLCSIGEEVRDSILEAFREEVIEAVERGPEAVEKTLAKWCIECPDREETFRKQAQAILLLWGLREPERLGPYQLLDVLTVGGMGKIYRAREDITGRIVVIKTVLAGHLSTAEQTERFDTERRLLSRLHDTHIVPLLATGQEGYLLYMAMPFIPGVTLKSMIVSASGQDPGTERFPSFEALFAAASQIESKKRLDATQVRAAPEPVEPVENSETASASSPGRDCRPADYFRRIAAMMEHVAIAVQHIHDAKILHRALKPSNIMIESSGHSWVIDIGLGRGLDEAENDCRGTIRDLARTGDGMTQGVGTLAYMAPEQLGTLAGFADSARPVRYDARTDVWGLGATLYELLALRLPFPGESMQEVAGKIASEPPELLNGGIPRELKAICLKALEKEPSQRYESTAAFAADLRRWLELRPTLAGEASIRRKAGRVLGWPWVRARRLGFWSRRRPAAAFAAGLLTALLLVGIAGAKAQLDAKQRELELLALPRLRQPIRQMDWFPKSWGHIRSLRGGNRSADPQLQGQAAAALEGIDAHVIKTLPGAAHVLEFDPGSKRLLIFRGGVDETKKPWFRTTLWDRTTYRTLVERDLGAGVLAFRPDGTPLQLSWVYGDLPKSKLFTKLRLFHVTSGEILREYRSPLEGLSHLRAIALSRQGSRLAAVALPVHQNGGALIPDGDTTTIAVWDAASDKPIQTLKHKATQDILLSPDGRLLAAWDTEGEITVWTLPDGKELRRFRVGRAPVLCLAFGRDPVWHEDGSAPPWLLAVGESHGLVTVWDLRAQRPRSVCRGSKFDVRAMDFSADGALLLTGGHDPSKLWDVATGTCLLDLTVGYMAPTLAFAPDGRHCAVSDGGAAAVEVVELELGHDVRTLYGLQNIVLTTIFSPDGRLVAGATHEWEIGIWEWPSGRLVGVLPVPVGRFVDNLGIAFDMDGRRLAFSGGRQAQLSDLQTKRLIKQWDLHEGLCDSLAFMAPEHLLLIRCETETGREGPFSNVNPRLDPRVVRIYDLLSPTPTKALREVIDFPVHVHAIRLAPGGSTFVVVGVAEDKDRLIRRSRVYAAPSGKLLHDLPRRLEPQASSTPHFDPSGKVLAVGVDRGEDGLGHPSMFDLAGLKYRGTFSVPVSCLNPGASWSMGRSYDRPAELALFDLARGQPLLRIAADVEATYSSFNFSPDGRHVMFGRRDGTISVLDLPEIDGQLSDLHLSW
jgi:serine/threonine protein kinase/WD40 repeat protein